MTQRLDFSGCEAAGLVLIETRDEWQTERRSFGLESTNKLKAPQSTFLVRTVPLRLAPLPDGAAARTKRRNP